jgi:hypothetical protein
VRRAQSEQSVEVPVKDLAELFAPLGASEEQIVTVLRMLEKSALLRNVSADEIVADSTLVLTRSGAYYSRFLSRKFVYVEECMFDTAIEDPNTWRSLHDLTSVIDGVRYPSARMAVRKDRIKIFLDYLNGLESEGLALVPAAKHVASLDAVRYSVLLEATDAVYRSKRYDPDDELKHL